MSMAQSDQEEVLPFDPRLGIGPDHLLGQLTVDVRLHDYIIHTLLMLRHAGRLSIRSKSQTRRSL